MKTSLRLALGCLLATGCVVSFDPGALCRTNEDCPDTQFCVATGMGDERRCALADSTAGGAAGGTAGSAGGGSSGGGVTGGGSAGGGSTAGGAAGGGDAGGTAGGEAGGSSAGGAGGGDAGGSTGGGDAGGASGGGDADGGVLDDGGVPDAGTALISLSRSNIDFGSLTVGGTSTPVTVVVRNLGSLPTGALSVSLSGAQATAFGIQSTSCTGAIGPGGTCQVDVVFAPGMQVGTLNGNLLVDGTPGGIQAVTLTGRSVTQAALSITPNMHPFGDVGLGSSSMPRSFAITNTGGSVSGIPNLSVTGNDANMFSIGNNLCTAPLGPSNSCTVEITFTPASIGAKTATLEARTSPGMSGSATLTASGLNPASLSANPATGSFPPTILASTANLNIVITNNGGVATPQLSTSVLGVNSGEFVRTTDGCLNQTLAALGTCTVSLAFTPGGTGPRVSTLTISGMGLTPLVVNLTGTGLAAAELQLATNLVDFGSVVTGQAGTATIGVTNRGGVPSGLPQFSVNPTGPFIITTNTCGTSIGAGSSCVVNLSFSPAASGSQSTTFTASANPGGSPTATLRGAGIAPGTLTITPPSRDFVTAVRGQTGAFQDFTIQNTGGTSVPLPVITVGGAASSSFVTSNNTCAAALAPNATCTVRVTFSPQGVGSLSGFINATAGSNTAQASLVGTGLAPASLSFSQSSLPFAATVVGQSSTQNFTLVNDGDVSSGNVFFGFSGTGATQFTIQSSTCSTGVPPRGSCTGVVLFGPLSAATHAASLNATATAATGASLPVSGVAITPAVLTLTPATGSNANYGNVLINTTQTMSFTVTNTGQQASGPLSLTLTGANASQWQLSSGPSACQLGQPLAGGQSCTTAIRFTAFTANGNGAKTATLTASAMPGSAPSLSLSANVQNPATLVTTTTTRDFQGQEVAVASMPFTWTIQNTGDLPTSTLSFTNSNPTEFSVSANTCTGTLAAGASCSMNVVFTPSAGGVRSGTLTLSATSGGTASLAATGRGQWRLTIVASFAVGTVSTLDGRLTNCGSSGCFALYDDGAAVTVRANPTANGASVHFGYWVSPTPASCLDYGNGNECQITMTFHTLANARYVSSADNMVFVSSTTIGANQGGSTAGFDSHCNTLATAAGINNTAGNAYVAWVSNDTSLVTATTRLGTGKGAFRRIDGVLFATSQTALLAGSVLSPPNLDEYGRRRNVNIWSGTYSNGTANTPNDCTNWSSTTGTTEYGITWAGPARWSNAFAGMSCSAVNRIVCLGKLSTTTATVPTVPSGGKIIYVTAASFTPSTQGAGLSSLDNFCNANKPTGYTSRTFVAFAASGVQAAGVRLAQASNYYRPDGHFVGTGADLLNGTQVNGIWQQNDLAYAVGDFPVWTGAVSPSSTTTVACSNWTTSGTTGHAGRTSSVTNEFFYSYNGLACTSARRIYCAEP